MPALSRISILAFVIAVVASCGAPGPATPTETFKTFVKASQKKDAASMKVMLSNATIAMHQQEAQAQNTKLDDIITRETFIGEGQRTVEYRNEKIDGDKASLEYKTSYGMWNMIGFVREDGVWKIDKRSTIDQMLEKMDESNRALDNIINGITPL